MGFLLASPSASVSTLSSSRSFFLAPGLFGGGGGGAALAGGDADEETGFAGGGGGARLLAELSVSYASVSSSVSDLRIGGNGLTADRGAGGGGGGGGGDD